MPLAALAAALRAPASARRIPGRRVVLAGVLAVGLLDLGWTEAALPRITRGAWRTVDDLPPGDGAALVLACGVAWQDGPGPMLAGRLRAALDLYRKGKVGWILVSGTTEEPMAMRSWLLEQGVPPSAIAADYASWRTYDSVHRARTLFGLHRVIVVTSDFHMPRTLWLARHEGLDAVGVASSTARLPAVTRVYLTVRELASRNRALLDVAVTPPEHGGDHDPPPSRSASAGRGDHRLDQRTEGRGVVVRDAP